eukprot:jgi/Hompol1/6936/HPOL_001691-RA
MAISQLQEARNELASTKNELKLKMDEIRDLRLQSAKQDTGSLDNDQQVKELSAKLGALQMELESSREFREIYGDLIARIEAAVASDKVCLVTARGSVVISMEELRDQFTPVDEQMSLSATPSLSIASTSLTADGDHDFRSFPDEQLDHELEDAGTNTHSNEAGTATQTSKWRDLYTACDLFAIDASPAMHAVPPGAERSPLVAALAAVSEYMKTKILHDPNDMIGVLFFGTRETSNARNADGIFVMSKLAWPDSTCIKRLEALAQGSEAVEQQFGLSDGWHLKDVFGVAAAIFQVTLKGSLRLARKRVFLITNNDDPSCGSFQYRQDVRKSISVLEEFKISVELFAIDQPPTRRFQFETFYNHIPELWFDEDVQSNKSISPTDNYVALFTRIKQQEFKKRLAFRVPMRFTNGLEIGIRGYYVIKEKAKSAMIRVDSSNRPVKSKTMYKCVTSSIFENESPATVTSIESRSLDATRSTASANDTSINREFLKSSDILSAYEIGASVVSRQQHDHDILIQIENNYSKDNSQC